MSEQNSLAKMKLSKPKYLIPANNRKHESASTRASPR